MPAAGHQGGVDWALACTAAPVDSMGISDSDKEHLGDWGQGLDC